MDSRDAKQRSLIFHELLLLLLLLLLGAVKVPGVEYGRPPQVSEPNLDSSKPPVQVHLIRGVLAFNSSNALVIPNERLPGVNRHGAAFTVMLALFLINARDGFRCVFWKGSSNSHRTPSMWLIPNDTRVTFRVSASEESWGTSRARLPVGQWCHVAFVSRGDGLLLLYINGRLDTALALGSPPVGNDGPLWLGRDNSQPGMEGMMSSIHFSNGFTMAAEVAAEASRVLESSSLPSFPSLGDALYSGGGSPPAIPLQGEEGRPHGKEPQGQAEVGLKPDAGEGGQTQAATWGGAWGIAVREERARLAVVGGVVGCATEEEQWAQEQQVLASLGPIERALASLRVKREQLRREQEEDSNIDALGGADKPLLDADVGRNEEKMVPVDGRPEGKGGQVDGADKAAVGQGKTVGAEDKAFEGEWRGEEGELVEAASPWTAFPNEMDWWRETCPLRLVRPEGHEDHASSLQEHHGDARGNRGQEAADKAARLHDDALREDNGEALDSLHESSTQKALWIHSRAADLGNPSALSTIGHMHAGGFGGLKPDDNSALFYYLQAAAHGDMAALLAMGYRHIHGHGVPRSCEAALYYAEAAARIAWETYNARGGQTRVEAVQLREGLSLEREDHKGEDDKHNELLANKASLGDSAAALALGRRYYWGTHGLEQDHREAFQHFEAARAAGRMDGTIGVAKMLLKGEGAKKNPVLALQYLNQAADAGSAEALNGLGFLYFKGDSVRQNHTLALGYFQRAARLGSADGMVNAGTMLRNGIGVDVDLEAAANYFEMGARRGHFACAYEIATMKAQGVGTKRDCEVAYGWYEAVSQVGPWARVLQAGLRSFLSGDALASAWAYSKASEMGYRTGTFNVAWLYGKALANARKERQVVATGVDRSYVSMLERAMQTFTKYCRRLALDGRSSPQERGWAQLQLGDSFYYGSSHGGQQVDKGVAFKYYREAGQNSQARGLFSAGLMLLHGDGVETDLEQAHDLLSTAHGEKEAPLATYAALAYIRVRKALASIRPSAEHAWKSWRSLLGSGRA